MNNEDKDIEDTSKEEYITYFGMNIPKSQMDQLMKKKPILIGIGILGIVLIVLIIIIFGGQA